MTDLAIRVENPCPERSRRMSKLYPSTWLPSTLPFGFAQDKLRIGRVGRIGALQNRHDTLRDAIANFEPGSLSLQDKEGGFQISNLQLGWLPRGDQLAKMAGECVG